MRTICIRELRHIDANFSLRNAASAYLIDSGSLTSQAIHLLLKSHIIECDMIEGPFLWVKPRA
ncbi:MAG: hypothetical protein ABR968_05630 [Bacteroidales bacterium]|jgi:hypothetical protein